MTPDSQKLEQILGSMHQIGTALSQNLEIDVLLPRIMEETTRLMGAERSTLYLVDKQRGQLWSKLAQKSEIREIRQTIGQGISGWVAQTGMISNIRDAYASEYFNPDFDRKTGFHTRSALTVPVFRPTAADPEHKSVLGVIQVLNKQDNQPFETDDERLLQALASQIAIALVNAELYSQLEDKTDRLDFLLNIEQLVNRNTDINQLLEQIIDRLTDYFHAQAGSLLLLDEENETLHFRVATGEYKKYLESLSLRRDYGIAGWVIRHRKSVLADRPHEDPRFNPEIAGKINMFPEAILCVPLLSNNRAAGCIELLNKKTDPERSFSHDDQYTLEILCGQIMRVLEILELKEQEQQQKRMADLGSMLSSIIHDIRSPLSTMQGYTEMQTEKTLKPERHKEYAEKISRLIDQMIGMSNELLDFARGETNIMPETVDIKTVYYAMRNQAREQIENKDIRIESDLKGSGTIRVDLNKMLRVFSNILNNAVEAMEKSEEKVFTFTVEEKQKGFLFQFEDQGPGIPENMQKKVFQPFFSTGKKRGTGLGLAIARSIVENHNGKMSVQNTGRGAMFRIFIPA